MEGREAKPHGCLFWGGVRQFLFQAGLGKLYNPEPAILGDTNTELNAWQQHAIYGYSSSYWCYAFKNNTL